MGEIDYLSYGFAAVVLGGGVMGFVKAGMRRVMGWEAWFVHSNVQFYESRPYIWLW